MPVSNWITVLLFVSTCIIAFHSKERNEGRLTSWQNQSNVPSQIVNYLYDGEGYRVAVQSNVSGTTTLTAYIGAIEEVQTTGSSTQTTTFYSVAGNRVAADVNGTFYYFGYDALGSQVAVLNATESDAFSCERWHINLLGTFSSREFDGFHQLIVTKMVELSY